MKQLTYNEMIDKAVALLNEGHSVEFINTDYLADSSGKIKFYFKNHYKAMFDILSTINVSYIQNYESFGYKSLVDARGLSDYAKRPDIKERYKGWKDCFYPPELIGDYCRSKLKDGETIMEVEIVTEATIEAMNFNFVKDPYIGETWLQIIKDGVTVFYDLEKKQCKCIMNEYNIITRICDSKEDIKKFVDCIKFLSA